MVTAADDHFRLRLQLPAGRRAPIYPGQYLLIEEDDEQLLRAEIDLAQSSGRSLSLLAARPPRVDGERVHIRYPLGHAFVAAPPQRPVWIVHGVARTLQAQLLRQHPRLPASPVIVEQAVSGTAPGVRHHRPPAPLREP